MSELQTLALEHLRELRQEVANHQNALARQQADQTQVIKRLAETLNALETRQNESETTLRHLSELYNHLLPLIESINNDVGNKPR